VARGEGMREAKRLGNREEGTEKRGDGERDRREIGGN